MAAHTPGKVYMHLPRYAREEGAPDMMDLLRQDDEIWNLFTRKEEYEKPDRDQFDRFSYYQSGHRDVFVPRASQMLVENGFSPEYPESRPFVICLSHDVDTVYQPLHVRGFEAAKALRERRLLDAGSIVRQLNPRKCREQVFEEITGLEDSYGARSSFYVLALEKGAREYAYPLEDLEQEISTIRIGGWEVGLHGGCDAYRDFESLVREKQYLESVLDRKVTGYRSHYLRFRVPETWELLERAGFLYDTSLGYPDCVGFRNGMCHPFRPYDLNRDREISVLEIPLVVMDRTLLLHMRLNPERAWDRMKRLFDAAERYHGVITVLWHNEFMTGDPLRFYRKILEYGREKGAWMTGSHEIAAWWRENGMRMPRAP